MSLHPAHEDHVDATSRMPSRDYDLASAMAAVARTAFPESTSSRSTHAEDGRHAGTFDAFVDAQLATLAEQPATPFVVLHNPLGAHQLDPSATELAHPQLRMMFLERVRHISHSIAATWVFLALPGRGSVGTTFDPTDRAAVEDADRAGHLRDVMLWYAESIQPEARTRYGLLTDDDEGDPHLIESTFVGGENPDFKHLLRT
jgi:hypothetical protein